MPCYHPLRGWRGRAPNRETGRVPIVFDIKKGLPKEEVLVPCGRCIGCRLERSRQWAIRCLHEASMHDFNCFITLTYDNYNLEKHCRIEDESDPDGLNKQYSLNKKQFQLFMKRLRKEVWENEKIRIKFYHCGEYGEKYGRPHHHVCIFGWWPLDATVWERRGETVLYESEFVRNIWRNGNICIGTVTFESAAYVARYITKKILGSMASEFYDGIQPEYTSCSLREAIGKIWWEKYKKDAKEDSIWIRGNSFARPPKYYDKRLDIEDSKELERRKEIRKKHAISNLKTRNERLKLERLQNLKQKSKRNYENG